MAHAQRRFIRHLVFVYDPWLLHWQQRNVIACGDPCYMAYISTYLCIYISNGTFMKLPEEYLRYIIRHGKFCRSLYNNMNNITEVSGCS
jgi:hypothetical protein